VIPKYLGWGSACRKDSYLFTALKVGPPPADVTLATQSPPDLVMHNPRTHAPRNPRTTSGQAGSQAGAGLPFDDPGRDTTPIST